MTRARGTSLDTRTLITILLLSMLPGALKSIAPLWPSYHLARLAHLQEGFADGVVPWLHAGVLLGVAVLFLFLARRRLAVS